MQIAIGTQVGYPSGSAKAAGIFAYFINDAFTTDRPAGSVHDTLAEPGPGRRHAVDSASKLRIELGQAIVAGSAPASGDPIILYGAVTRIGGRMAIAETTPSGTTAPFRIGFNNSGTAGGSYHACRFDSSSVIAVTIGGTNLAGLGAWAAGTTYQIAIILRAQGLVLLIKGGAFTNWTLLLVTAIGATTPLYPCLAALNIGSGFTTNWFKVPVERWLPAPVVSDGFSAWGSSDGLGHAEGIAGGLGSGGGGKAWMANVGTWGAAGGVASARALSGGRAIAIADSGKADLVISVNCTFLSGTMSLIVRWVDENNHVQIRLTAANRQLVKVVAGVATTLSDSAYTYVAGAELRLVCQGDKFRTFYNNAAIGAEFTISDAALQAPTVVGLRTDNIGNTFDNFVAYARGTGGEYSALDAF